MEISEKLDAFFSEEHIFKTAVLQLRSLILESGLNETYKWSFPTYTLENKNVVAIGKFKNHFVGIILILSVELTLLIVLRNVF